MCRVLVSLSDNTVIHAIEDDQEFGRLERPPVFGIVEMPELSVVEFRADLQKDEEAIYQQKEQEALDRAVIKAQGDLRDIRDPKRAQQIIDFHKEMEMPFVQVEYKIPQLTTLQLAQLRAGRVTLPVDKLTRDQLFTQEVKETFREVR